MKRIIYLSLLLGGMLFSNSAFAQQDAQFSHYMFVPNYYNAGANGIEGVSRATLLHRSQWLGYQGIDDGGAPTTQLLTVDHPLKLFSSATYNSGVGLSVVHDVLGPWRIFDLKGAFSYHVKLQNGGVLGTGIRAGIFSQGIDASLLRASEDGDRIVDGLGNGTTSQMKPDISVGIHYQTTKYWGGVGLTHIARTEFEFNVNPDSIASRLSRHMFVSGGYNWYIGRDLLIAPSAIIQTDFSETTFNYGVIGSLNNYKYWGGLTLRQSFSGPEAGPDASGFSNDDIVLLVGMSFLDNNDLRVGYSFDLVTSGTGAKNPTSHEIMLSYVLPLDPDSKYTPIRTPRYRKEN